MANQHQGVRQPLGVEGERIARRLRAEDRRRHPARGEARVGGREHEVLDRGAQREQRHSPFGALAGGVGVPVEAFPREAAEDERRRARDLAVRRLDELVDARVRDGVLLEVASPLCAHPVRE